MAVTTLNVSLSEEQASIIGREVEGGLYASASEVVREALREWIKRRIESDVAALEKAHAGAYERDTTPEEMEAILRIQKRVRAFVTHWICDAYRRVAQRMETESIFPRSPWPLLDWFMTACHEVIPGPL